MSQSYHTYSNDLSLCMVDYQFIEEVLKQCLFRCHAIIKFRTNGIIPYEAPLESIDNSAMGRLIDQFKNMTTDQELITKLRRVKKHRDHCAHKGYILDSKERNNEEFMEEKSRELKEFHNLASECMEILNNEFRRLDALVENVYASLVTEQSKQAGTP